MILYSQVFGAHLMCRIRMYFRIFPYNGLLFCVHQLHAKAMPILSQGTLLPTFPILFDHKQGWLNFVLGINVNCRNELQLSLRIDVFRPNCIFDFEKFLFHALLNGREEGEYFSVFG